MGGTPRIGTSDLGLEFHNVHFQDVCKRWGIKHLKPKTGARIAPYIENRVKQYKKYTRLLSHLLFKGMKWWEPEVIKNACKSVNNIQRESGYSAREIVFKFKNHGDMSDIIKSYQSDEEKDNKLVGVPTIQKGDFVRIRVAPQKLGFHKSHLGFKGTITIRR